MFANASLSDGTAGPTDAGGSGRLVNLSEPHASLLELFLRVRGNVKDVERELGLSYPTVRARLEEAFRAAQPLLSRQKQPVPQTLPVPAAPTSLAVSQAARAEVLDALERGNLTAAEATTRLHDLKKNNRSHP